MLQEITMKRLSEYTQDEIRSGWNVGSSMSELADYYQVSPATISKAIDRSTIRYLEEQLSYYRRDEE